SDRVVTVTDKWANILKKFHPKFRDKVSVIYNGYDEFYLENVETESNNTVNLKDVDKSDSMKIVSFGKLSYYSKYYSKLFFSALKKSEIDIPEYRIIQIGEPEPAIDNIINETNFDKNKYINTG